MLTSSRYLFTVSLLALSWAVSAAPPAPSKAAVAGRAKVIVVGWDGGDWSLLDPLMKEGKLPNLAALTARGRTWDLSSMQPMISPLIWTTIATGRTPVDHGVADFQEYDPKTRDRLPISGRSRKLPAIWNLASAKGVSVGVVGWWATWPAERVKGFLVSDRASPVLFDFESLSKSPALTWPEGLADGVRIIVKREGTPGFEEVVKGLDISRADFDAGVAAKQDLSNPITGYQKILGSTRVTAKIGLDLSDREKPDLLMVYFQGTDEIGHVLGRYHPPRLATIPEDEFRKYSRGVVTFYLEADRILGEFVRRAEREGATLVLVSDHGFKWGSDRPAYYSGVQFDTAFLWHHSPGILAAMGPDLTPSAKREKASVFDIAPTLCRLLGLPADPAFEGKPVAGLVSTKTPKAPPAASWAKAATVERLVVSGSGGGDRKAADEFTKKLISLGYLSGTEASAVDARPPDRAGTETAGTFQNIGTFLRDRGKVQESLDWYRKALEVNPRSATTWLNLSIALHLADFWSESDDALITAAKMGYHDPEAALYRRVSTYMQRVDRKPKARTQLVEFLRKVVEAYPGNDRYRASLGKALFEGRQCAEAQKIFREVVARQKEDFESWNLVAITSLCLNQTEEAREAFRRSLAINPKQEAVTQGLAELDHEGGK